MRGSWIGLALCASAIVGSSPVRADDVGCCEVECHSTDDAGRALHSVQRTPLAQAECESRSPDCDVTWRAEACDVGGSVGTFEMRMPER